MTATSKKTSARKTPSKTSSADARAKSRIVFVAPQPRRKGTKSYKFYAEMEKFVKAHKNHTVAQLIEETNYRPEDFKSDLAHEYIKIKKVG